MKKIIIIVISLVFILTAGILAAHLLMKKETKTVQKTVHTESVARFADPAILPDSMERHLESVTAKFEGVKKTAAPVTAAKTKISQKVVRKPAATVKDV